jgi:hypothetical protein
VVPLEQVELELERHGAEKSSKSEIIKNQENEP